MVVKSYNLGPGVLELGAGPLAVSAQVRSCIVECTETVTRTEAKPVLSGEELPASESATFAWTIKIKFLQDLDAGGVVDWSWINKGTSQEFNFVPNTVVGRAVTGNCSPIPISIGGDLPDPSPEADATWRVIGTPAFGAAA